jgi:IS30 family transposase
MYTHLTRDQRIMIYILKRKGLSQVKIAKEIGYSQSTISRELLCNQGKRGYRFKQADFKASQRKSKTSQRSSLSKDIKSYIVKRLEKKWSPEQMSKRMKRELRKTISHETIYKFIKRDKEKRGTLYKNLRCQKKKRKRYGKATQTRGVLKDRVSIDQRPTEALKGRKIGHLEADLIIGKHHKKALLTVVEKKTKMTFISPLSSKRSREVVSALIKLLRPYKKDLKMLTLDNGKEWGHHKEIERKLGL